MHTPLEVLKFISLVTTIDTWMDGLMDGWIDGWMDGWILTVTGFDTR
jgi:hypothetical protein